MNNKIIPEKDTIVIYTDGSSLGNPGKGGWGIIFLTNKKAYEMSGFQKVATNNQMELEAIKQAFVLMTDRQVSGYSINIYSDSKYCIDGLEKWIVNWRKNNWKTSAKKDVANKQYWIEISEMKEFLKLENTVTFHHVKAHSGELYNERVDDLARITAEQNEIKKFNGSISDYLI